jgi:hypothetical protein
MLKILKSTSIIILASFLIAIIFLPLATNATDQLVPCGSGNDPNNRCTLCHLIIGIHRVLNYGYYVAFVVALACVTFAGIMYLVSTGDEKLMTSAKGFIRSSLIGFAVIFCAWIIVNSILLFFSAKPDMGIGRTNWYTFECVVPTAIPAPPPPPPIPTTCGQPPYEGGVCRPINCGAFGCTSCSFGEQELIGADCCGPLPGGADCQLRCCGPL